MHIKKGDNVMVIAGSERGRKGHVLKALPRLSRVVVEGLNMRKNRLRPRRAGEKGSVVERPASMHASNVKKI